MRWQGKCVGRQGNSGNEQGKAEGGREAKSKNVAEADAREGGRGGIQPNRIMEGDSCYNEVIRYDKAITHSTSALYPREGVVSTLTFSLPLQPNLFYILYTNGN